MAGSVSYFNFVLRTYYIMKKHWIASVLLMFGAYSLSAQTTMRDKMLKDRKEFSDRTLFQQFDNKMVPTAEERKQKRYENQAKRERLLTIIDTIQLKTELKQKLKYDVMNDPFSGRLRKFLEKHDIKDKLKLTD